MLLDCMFMLLCSPMISPKRKPNVKEIEGTVKKKNETNCFYLGTTGREQQKKQKRRKRRCGRAAGDENETRLGCSNRLIDFNSSSNLISKRCSEFPLLEVSTRSQSVLRI
ncbi:hypothetical protein HanIR_Chr12g0586111 [Helianthus annuus]|nr:hypothetical protein HanIR_Chr12g0586111 [Helianthus annuus]